MNNATISIIKLSFCSLMSISLVGCTSAQRATQSHQIAPGIPRLASAYHAAAGHRQDPHASIRLPIRKARKRSFATLAKQCDALLEGVEAWDSDARLTSVDATERDEIRLTVAAFRDSLHRLSEAADQSQVSKVREHYAAALASYRRLLEVTGVVN